MPRFVFLMCIAAAHAAWASTIQIDKVGERYTLIASNASLNAVLQRIDDLEPATLRLYGGHDQAVTVTYRNQTLDQLLSRLGVSYVLVYEGNDTDGYHLGDAMRLDSDVGAMTPELRAQILRAIKNLRHDHIAYNAMSAMMELQELGCVAVPLLEAALHTDDYQTIHCVASILRTSCPEYVPSDRLLDVTLALMSLNGYDEDGDVYLFGPGEAYHYLRQHSNVYPRVRSRLIANLDSMMPHERLQAALLLGEYAESSMAARLVRILAPHLADNDLRADGAAAAYAIYRLGPTAKSIMEPYRTSPDRQQAELAGLICSAWEQNRVPEEFSPTMYVGYTKNPLQHTTWVDAARWYVGNFPDDSGRYPNLSAHRRTTRDYYAPYHYEEVEVGGDDGPAEPSYDLDAPFPYTTREGDTLRSIAERFNVLESMIRAINVDVNLDMLAPGTKLNIPWL